MPPIVTLAPILADPADFSRQSGTEINPFIFIKGSLVYQALFDSNTGTIAMFKATAAGVNSLALDTGNAPAVRTGGAMIGYSDPASDIITIAYRETGSFNLAIVNFDTATDTYGTPIVSTLNSGTAFAAGIGLFYRPGSGLYYVIYPVAGQLSYRTIDGAGTTSSAVAMTAAVSAGQGLFYTAFDESTGIASIFYLVSIAGGHFDCITLSAADIVGTTVNITTDGVEWVEAVIESGTLNVAWVNGNGKKVYASSATVSASPTFSAAANIVTVVAPAGVTYISIAFIAGVLTVIWCLTDFSFNPGVDEIDYSQFVASAWTTPDLFYDELTNPPAGGLTYPDQFVHTIQLVGISNGWFAFTAMETAGACTGFILVAPGVTPPPPGGCTITVFPFGPEPPPFCELPPAIGQEQLILVNEPLENQGT